MQDFMDAMRHATELLKKVSSPYIIVAMPDNDDAPGASLEFFGDVDELLMLQGRAEALIHNEAMLQIKPTLERPYKKPDQVNDPGVV